MVDVSRFLDAAIYHRVKRHNFRGIARIVRLRFRLLGQLADDERSNRTQTISGQRTQVIVPVCNVARNHKLELLTIFRRTRDPGMTATQD
jgi:hypothetical protein